MESAEPWNEIDLSGGLSPRYIIYQLVGLGNISELQFSHLYSKDNTTYLMVLGDNIWVVLCTK